jgi:hypothetical protein
VGSGHAENPESTGKTEAKRQGRSDSQKCFHGAPPAMMIQTTINSATTASAAAILMTRRLFMGSYSLCVTK